MRMENEKSFTEFLLPAPVDGGFIVMMLGFCAVQSSREKMIAIILFLRCGTRPFLSSLTG
jgi:Na+/glutamate symporter